MLDGGGDHVSTETQVVDALRNCPPKEWLNDFTIGICHLAAIVNRHNREPREILSISHANFQAIHYDVFPFCNLLYTYIETPMRIQRQLFSFRLAQNLSHFAAQSRPLSTMSSKTKTPDITLYTAQTPNGVKISMALEELGLVSLFATPSKGPMHAIRKRPY